jgi:hypothetical protein
MKPKIRKTATHEMPKDAVPQASVSLTEAHSILARKMP